MRVHRASYADSRPPEPRDFFCEVTLRCKVVPPYPRALRCKAISLPGFMSPSSWTATAAGLRGAISPGCRPSGRRSGRTAHCGRPGCRHWTPDPLRSFVRQLAPPGSRGTEYFLAAASLPAVGTDADSAGPVRGWKLLAGAIAYQSCFCARLTRRSLRPPKAGGFSCGLPSITLRAMPSCALLLAYPAAFSLSGHLERHYCETCLLRNWPPRPARWTC